MLEIIAIVCFCRLIGNILRPAGVPTRRWQLLTVGLWFLGEFVGMVLGSIVFGLGSNGSLPLAPYVFAILGALSGAYLSVRLAQRRAAHATPDPTKCASCGYSRTGIAPGIRCPECGLTPSVGAA